MPAVASVAFTMPRGSDCGPGSRAARRQRNHTQTGQRYGIRGGSRGVHHHLSRTGVETGSAENVHHGVLRGHTRQGYFAGQEIHDFESSARIVARDRGDVLADRGGEAKERIVAERRHRCHVTLRGRGAGGEEPRPAATSLRLR